VFNRLFVSTCTVYQSESLEVNIQPIKNATFLPHFISFFLCSYVRHPRCVFYNSLAIYIDSKCHAHIYCQAIISFHFIYFRSVDPYKVELTP